MSPEAQARAKAKAEALRAEMPLNELRNALEISQKHLAEVLRVDQPSISRMERRTDMMLSTLARFVEAMGGNLEMVARFPNGSVHITGLAQIREGAKREKSNNDTQRAQPA
jgi:transcriptional regulator with XRE-family HTH domain